jgi:hypothetical protein
MVESKFRGLSRKEIEMRKMMAERFGNRADHLQPPKKDELKIDSNKMY